MGKTFSYINDQLIQDLISRAGRYIVYAAPSVSEPVAKAFVTVCTEKPGLRTHIVLDVDAEPMRLGFGDTKGLPYLFKHNVEIHTAPGLRVGVLVVDEEAWVYAPTAEIILKQPDGAFSNAVKVSTDFALEMIPAVAPQIAEELNILDATVIRGTDDKLLDAEIGQTIAVRADIERVEQSIAENPPVKFDHERHLRVYKGFFQFVKLEFIGGRVGSKTIKIPSTLLNIAAEDDDLRERIKSTCRLVDKSNPFAKQFTEFRRKVDRVRHDYTRPLGSRYGSVILRKIRPEFDQRVQKLKTEMAQLSAEVEAELQSAINESREKLIKMLLPGFIQHLPAHLRAQSLFEISEDKARKHLENALDHEIPAAANLVSRMELNCDYKDITYEMLTDKRFIKLVKDKYELDLDALHEEESAAGERTTTV
jgi:hypothetical protein